jgi:hypothetical protein
MAMLVKIGDEWLNVSQLDFTHDPHPDEPGFGAFVNYRGEPGFVCLCDEAGAPVLVSAKHVVGLREAHGGTEIETTHGRKLTVRGQAAWVSGVLNHASLRA